FAHRDKAIFENLNRTQSAARESARVGKGPLFLAKHCQLAPGANEDTGFSILKIAAGPGRRARAVHGGPRLAAIRRAENAAGEWVLAIAQQKTGLWIGEAHGVQPG